MAAAKRKAIWLSWVPFLVMAAGWRLWSGVVDPVPVLTVYGVAIGALVLWGTVRRSRPAARTPAERRAATEARWAQGAVPWLSFPRRSPPPPSERLQATNGLRRCRISVGGRSCATSAAALDSRASPRLLPLYGASIWRKLSAVRRGNGSLRPPRSASLSCGCFCGPRRRPPAAGDAMTHGATRHRRYLRGCPAAP